ncbi:MAG TPA: ribosome biogenesis factor YjgA [Polyangiaceae bacterium]|jgi:ribosome-associated protein|nr:ribosome biogenesis factor YjgA [Polyangiaceae bacterium]
MAPRVDDAPLDPESAEPEEDLRSRGDERRARQEVETALAHLARDLVELSDGKLARLQLPEPVLDAVQDARAIKSFAARNRALRLVRTVLRGGDWSLIRVRLDMLVRHGTVPALPAGGESSLAAQAQEWMVRLRGEGTQAIEALLALCPSGDRTHLRTLLRQIDKADAPERRKKAEQRLADAVESLLRSV